MKKNILKKYIFVSIRIIYESIEFLVTVLENLNEWHIQSSLQMKGTYRLFYKYDSFLMNFVYINTKNRKFYVRLTFFVRPKFYYNQNKSNFENNLEKLLREDFK